MAKPGSERVVRVAEAQDRGPAAVITRRAADRLRAGHLWVYASDLEELVPGPGTDAVAGGSLATVVDSRGVPLGTGIYSSASQIALRMVSVQPALPRASYLESVRCRVQAALELRRELGSTTLANNAGRLIFSEADGLPGIVADRYNDLVILQLLTQGTAQDDVREVVSLTIQETLGGGLTIWERPDARVRELEELGPPPAGPVLGEDRQKTVFSLNGLRFHFDAGSGQKTGAFLDQGLNYAVSASYAHGSALDVCTYQGGFALHLAEVCERVTGVDSSRAALEVADLNLQLNPHLQAQVDWIEADAFELLREYEGAGTQYDTVVLDPPAFAKSTRALEGAMRGYKELNLRAMRMLRGGGTLVTCSCSHHVSLESFVEVLAAAASDAGRRVQVLETRGAALDHPAILTLPETAYLKCVICRLG